MSGARRKAKKGKLRANFLMWNNIFVKENFVLQNTLESVKCQISLSLDVMYDSGWHLVETLNDQDSGIEYEWRLWSIRQGISWD